MEEFNVKESRLFRAKVLAVRIRVLVKVSIFNLTNSARQELRQGIPERIRMARFCSVMIRFAGIEAPQKSRPYERVE